MEENTSIASKLFTFDWDEGNDTKNYNKHKVSKREAEEVFLNEPIVINPDFGHSQDEIRYQGLGQTDANRKLFFVFAVRDKKIRVISIRDQNRSERSFYESA